MPISFLAQGIPSGSHSFGAMWLSQPTLTQITPQDDHTQQFWEEENRKIGSCTSVGGGLSMLLHGQEDNSWCRKMFNLNKEFRREVCPYQSPKTQYWYPHKGGKGRKKVKKKKPYRENLKINKFIFCIKGLEWCLAPSKYFKKYLFNEWMNDC